MKLELKKIDEDSRRILYKIANDENIIDNKVFKLFKNTSNLSTYLNSKGSSLIELLNNSINNICINCECSINNNRFERNVFVTYKYCEKCDITKIRRKYKIVKCSMCDKEIYAKDRVESTCGDQICVDKHKKIVSENITKTHWCNTCDKYAINIKKVKTRLENDKLYNRKYTAWNKGKTGIYSKETIEKLRNATIKQMKFGRIKKSKQEKIFELFLIENDIKYIYSFIYKKRQYDFLLIDYNLVIELQGDYWHANPDIWDTNGDDANKRPLYETQKMKIKDDIIKKELIMNSKYDFVEFWEFDIYNNFTNIITTLQTKFSIKIKNDEHGKELQ